MQQLLQEINTPGQSGFELFLTKNSDIISKKRSNPKGYSLKINF